MDIIECFPQFFISHMSVLASVFKKQTFLLVKI
jgi:hypothetical protein